MTDMTYRELAQLLDPPMTRAQIATLTAIAGIQPSGVARTGTPGRPPRTYDALAVMRAHAQEAQRTIKQFSDNDWIGAALIGRALIRVDVDAGIIRWPSGERAEKLGTGHYGYVHAGSLRCPAHRIIWMAADGEIPPPMQINHLNHRRWDNRRANLELVSFGNNIRHAHGTPYVNYHEAIDQLSALPAPVPVITPSQDLTRAGGVFRKLL